MVIKLTGSILSRSRSSSHCSFSVESQDFPLYNKNTPLTVVQSRFHGSNMPTQRYTDSSPSILKELQWLPIDARVKFKIATLTFKALNTGNPPYLPSLLHWHTPCRTLRSASANLLSVMRCNLSFGTRGFRTAAPTIWNSLPANVRSSATLSTFRLHLKSHLFQSSFPTA